MSAGRIWRRLALLVLAIAIVEGSTALICRFLLAHCIWANFFGTQI